MPWVLQLISRSEGGFFLSMESEWGCEKLWLLKCFWKGLSCAWSDLSLFTGNAGIHVMKRIWQIVEFLKELFELIYNFPKVVIALFRGHAWARRMRLVTVLLILLFSVPSAFLVILKVAIGLCLPWFQYSFWSRSVEQNPRNCCFAGELITSSQSGWVRFDYRSHLLRRSWKKLLLTLPKSP